MSDRLDSLRAHGYDPDTDQGFLLQEIERLLEELNLAKEFLAEAAKGDSFEAGLCRAAINRMTPPCWTAEEASDE